MIKGIIDLSILISSPTTNDKMSTKAPVAGPAYTVQQEEQPKGDEDHKEDNLHSTNTYFKTVTSLLV